MKNLSIKRMCRIAIVASIYAVLTVVWPLSWNEVQFRFAEALLFLCLLNVDYIVALTLGCLVANMFSPLGMPDIIFGTLATLISGILIYKIKKVIPAIFIPGIVNGIVVGLELTFIFNTPFWINLLGVAFGEVVVGIVGFIIYKIINRNERIMEILK